MTPRKRPELRIPYFAYGSNLCINDMLRRCPEADWPNVARLHNWRLTFSGVADIEPVSGKYVPGGLWWITPRCLAALDRYEGAPHLYRQYPVLVETAAGMRPAMTYVMNDSKPMPPSGGYLNCIREGYADFSLDTSLLDEAVRRVYDELTRVGVTEFVPNGKKRLQPAPERYEEFYDDDLVPDDAYDEFETPLEEALREEGIDTAGMSPATRAALGID